MNTLKRLLLPVLVVCLVGGCKKGGGDSDNEGQVDPSLTEEATINLRRLFDGSVTYFDNDHATASGALLPHQFPASTPVSPALSAIGCEPNTPTQAHWSAYTWEDLNFAVSDPHYYAYQYDSAGTRMGATFTATAFGDLDCDGVYSTFVRTGVVVDGMEIRGDEQTFNELE